MATITTATTVATDVRGSTVRWAFRYTLDTGEVYEQRAWVPVNTDEATERDRRGQWLLDSLAEAEVDGVLNG